MKTIIITLVILFIQVVLTNTTQAAEYQCNVSSTRAEGCEAYFDKKEVCAFPDALNKQRTKEAKTSSFTYPQFCLETCAEKSNIPAKCRKGSITERVTDGEPAVTKRIDLYDGPRGGYIPRDLYVEADTYFGQFWNWVKRIFRGEDFKIKPMSTPVAGVRG